MGRRSLPAKLQLKTRPVLARGICTVTDGLWTDEFLFVPAHMKQRRAFRSAKPLVTIARILCGSEVIQIQWNHARCVRSVHQRVHAATVQLFHQPRDGQHDSGLACQMIEQRQPRSWRDTFHNRRDQFIRAAERKWNFRNHHACAGMFRNEVQRIAAGVVFMVGDEQFVARL